MLGVISLLSSLSNYQQTSLSGAAIRVAGGQDLEGISKALILWEVTEKLIKDFVPPWARWQNGASRVHWRKNKYSEVPGESLAHGDLRTSTGWFNRWDRCFLPLRLGPWGDQGDFFMSHNGFSDWLSLIHYLPIGQKPLHLLLLARLPWFNISRGEQSNEETEKI